MIRRRFPLTLAAGLALSGCSIFPEPAADPTRFFVLTGPSVETAARAELGPLTLGVRTVTVAPYLRGRSMIVREGEHELTYQDYARWAESLDQGIARILNGRLLVAPAVGQVYLQPFPFDRPRDFDVAISVLRCEGVRAGGTAVARFAAQVEITRVSDGSVVSRRVFAAPDLPWDGRNYEALAAALSTSVERLASEVIAALPDRP